MVDVGFEGLVHEERRRQINGDGMSGEAMPMGRVEEVESTTRRVSQAWGAAQLLTCTTCRAKVRVTLVLAFS
jgi:hypothetical protein